MSYLSFREFFVKPVFVIKQLTQKQRPLIDLTHGCTGTGKGTGTDTGTVSLRSGCVVSGSNLKRRGVDDGWGTDVEVAWRTVVALHWLLFRSSSSFRRRSLFAFVRCLILNKTSYNFWAKISPTPFLVKMKVGNR